MEQNLTTQTEGISPLARQYPFLLPTMDIGDFTAEELAEDMDGLSPTLPRIKIPGGGVLQFEMPGSDPDNPDYVKNLVGVMLYSHSSNAYWPTENDGDDDQPPACMAVTGKQGVGEPGGLCEDCYFNTYGSSNKPGSSGKACKNMRMVYLLQSGELMPAQLALPPTSIKPYTQFVNANFLNRKKRVFSGLVQIGLTRGKNAAGKEYSVATFTKLRDFEGEELAQIKSFASAFIDQIKAMNQQRAAMKEAESNIVDGEAGPSDPLPDNDGHFSYGVVDGDRGKLPA